jgi:lysophospholipase L1-like esterase
MLGDSLTEYNIWDGLDPQAKIINLGLSGDTGMGVLFRLNRVFQSQPDLVFLQVGINDLSQGRKPQEIVSTSERIWAGIKNYCPEAKIIVCSLAPVLEEKFCWDTEVLRNSRIRQTNSLLAQKALEAKLDYIDLYAPLADQEQKLPDNFTDDGVHLTAAAYEVWMLTLQKYLEKFKL